MKNKYSIRKATVEDAATIFDLATNIWNAHYPSIISLKQIAYMLHTRYAVPVIKKSMLEGERFFLLSDGDVCKAYASIEERESDTFLHKFYVLVDQHRSGIGQELFSYILKNINSDKPIRLQVNRKNIKAINFYFKHGFVIENAQDFDIGNGFTMEDFVMVNFRK
ncbi:MAG: GNAT family N-acetyltransferase [Bacteroidetes bacterium]|nr:GNAT family N-acetyltransferase [Bacteroidota bacterium]